MSSDPVKLLPVLYEAASDISQWPVFLAGVAAQTDAKIATLMARDDTGTRCTLILQHGNDREAERLYAANYWKMDAFYINAQQRGFFCASRRVKSWLKLVECLVRKMVKPHASSPPQCALSSQAPDLAGKGRTHESKPL